jgi:hypothetical protein
MMAEDDNEQITQLQTDLQMALEYIGMLHRSESGADDLQKLLRALRIARGRGILCYESQWTIKPRQEEE